MAQRSSPCHLRREARTAGSSRWVLALLALATLGLLATGCGSADSKATPPPATIIRASGDAQPTVAAGESATIPAPPTLPADSTGGETYPQPQQTVETPVETATPIVYPTP